MLSRMRTELVSIATDTVPLDGAFHWPEDRRARGGVLLFHGNTMNFYTGAPRWLPPVLTELGFACLAFNRRGHDILSIRDSRAPEGGALQLTHEGIADNDYAAGWMAERGFPAPIVIAHSGGGLLGAAHAAAHPETPALVLLSAFRGGTGEQSIAAQMALAGEGYEATMARAQSLVAAGRGKELMTVPNWWYVISAESYLDRSNSTPGHPRARSDDHVSGPLRAGQRGAERGVSRRSLCRTRGRPVRSRDRRGRPLLQGHRGRRVRRRHGVAREDAACPWMIKSSAPARAHRHTIRDDMSTDLEAAWDELHDAKPDGWFVGPPTYVEDRREWEQYAFDTRERPKAGHRSREWTAVAELRARGRARDGAVPAADPRGTHPRLGVRPAAGTLKP